MAKIQGTNVSAPIVPFTDEDTYAVVIDEHIKGGYRTVGTQTIRDNIPLARRSEGMAVYVKADAKLYILQGGLDNTCWTEYISSNDVTTDDIENKIDEHEASAEAHADLFAKMNTWLDI
jgi:hypothetical protein